MISHLYRIRPIERLLDCGELQKQEIFFARPETLNDPMEGFRDIYWHGDEIVWGSLLRHYLLCVERAFVLFVTCGETQAFGWGEISVFNGGDTSFSPRQKAKHEEIIQAFFSEDSVKAYIRALSARMLPVRRNELALHLRTIHLFAISLIRECYERHGMLAKQDEEPLMFEKLRSALAQGAKAVEHVNALEAKGPNSEFQIDSFFALQQQTMSELDLINQYNAVIDPSQANRIFVFVNFCDEYVKKIETLVYPDWYTACFMGECQNSSVWGNYGVNHTAVCLKFKVKDVSGKPYISLRGINGIGSNGPCYGQINHEFLEIKYEHNHLPINFFKSLGRLPIPTLNKYWFGDAAGGRSACGDDMFKNEQQWRDDYWKGFYHGITRKLDDWSYEKEYRLILATMVLDFSSDESRKIKYDFADLDGIIFGMKTPFLKKLEICRIIEEKCRASGRTDFKFYQAFYWPQRGTIEHAEMRFLKFKPPL